ncbi:MAG: hypothetical protein QM791_07190 [Ferruginibacter sp.]
MKKYLPLLIILLSASIVFTKCTKTVEPTVKPRLFISVKDEKGTGIEGVPVRIYKDSADPGSTKLSDTSGNVIFYNLDPVIYYWWAQKDCKTNRISQTTLNRALIPNTVMYGYSVLTETAALKISNNSTGAYKISDSVFSTTIKADTSFIVYHKTGNYKIRTEITGDTTTRKDTTIRFTCGDTSYLNIY